VNEDLRSPPEGMAVLDQVEPNRGLAYVDPADPALPMYRILANLRSPVALRDMMLIPVRTGYIGDDTPSPDPALVPISGAEAVPDVSCDTVYLPLAAGAMRCEVYRPSDVDPDERLPVIVYYHGGGFMIGRSEDTDFLTRKLAITNRALVVSANYRMAPEYPFPTPLDDAMGVYYWVCDHADQLDGDDSRIAVAGDSAGSNFAAAIPVRTADEGTRLPDAVVLLGALCDMRFELYESFRLLAPRGIVYDSAFMGFLRGAYIPNVDWAHPWVSPITAELSGYPPTVIATGTHDPLHDSAQAFADAVVRAGGTVTAYWPEGMPHGFYFFPGVFAAEAEAHAMVSTALAEVFAR
jgi:acetyl esterase